MGVSVRRLTGDDVTDYRRIRLQALRDHPDAFAASYETTAARSDAELVALLHKLIFFGAFDGNELSGIVAFDQSTGDKERHRGWLLQMYVAPSLRGTGAGLRLIETLCDYARGRVLQIHLGVASHNEAAKRLYAKAGFVTYGTDPRYLHVDGRYIDEDMMVRFLDKAPERDPK